MRLRLDNMSTPRKLILGLVVSVTILILMEFGFRLVLRVFNPEEVTRMQEWRERWTPMWDPSPVFSPHPYLAYTNDSSVPTVNEDGFFGDDRPQKKPAGTIRIACIGGSTTAGPESWPRQLEEVLEEALPGQDVEAFNYGVPGWTSAGSLINWVLNAQDFEHDLVIIHHAANDMGPALREDFHRDYRHYRKTLELETGPQRRVRIRQGLAFTLDMLFARISDTYLFLRVRLGGEVPDLYTLTHLTVRISPGPPPETALAVLDANLGTFVRNLETIGLLASARGTRVVLTTMPHLQAGWPEDEGGGQPSWAESMTIVHRKIEDLAKARGWAFLDLHAAWVAEGPDAEESFEDPIHLDPHGHRLKAELIATFLTDEGLIDLHP